MDIMDGHADLPWEMARHRLTGEGAALERHRRRLCQGGIRGLGLSLWTTRRAGDFWPPEWDGWQRTEHMVCAAREALAQTPWIRQVETSQQAREALAAGQSFAVFTVEGMEPIGTHLERLEQYAAWGVRMGMLTWNEENRLAAGAGAPPDHGLTDLGRTAVRRMQEMKILPDVSHSSDASFWDILALAQGPVVASHSNCRSLCDARRNLTDEQLRAIRDTGGVVGLNGYHGFVHKDPRQQTVAMLARHAAHMAEVMGPRHIVCGFDFGDYYGAENDGCQGLEDAGKAGELFLALEALGFSEQERRGIAMENWLRIL